MEITCKTPKALWERISEFEGEIKIIKVSFEKEKLISVTIKKAKKAKEEIKWKSEHQIIIG